ncbi:Phyllosphere-induced regulator PhyR [Methylobacterium iners]|uniref:Phyllosphere-induced regulator PhyR n=2 Tax=Methylobacterium iners TaxID=418707 RepID=A0ABQ4S392_9HYPH|nr:Phyllosphere-induced regulator PhyR [Methylobacterium iners]
MYNGTMTGSASRTPPLRVMIVEDEPLISLALQEIVRSCGHVIAAVVDNAEDAVAHAAHVELDLALMDISLHGRQGGIDAAVALREAHDLRSIFVTAHTDPGTRDLAQAAWPLGLVAKPIHPARLNAALRNAAGTLAALAARAG